MHQPILHCGRHLAGALRAAVCSLLIVSVAGILSTATGCNSKPTREKVVVKPKYQTLPPKANVPAFMKGTIFEYADVENKAAYPVSGFGLIVGLEGTGSNQGVPLAVQNHIVDEMVRRGFGSTDEILKKYKPEAILQDPRTAIVEVYAMLPAGARAGSRCDIYVQAMRSSFTKSLARGHLYQTNLFDGGADPLNPKGHINVFARAQGPVFVNPAYVTGSAAGVNLRAGVIMNGGMVSQDRPLFLRVRSPQLSLAVAMAERINLFVNDTTKRTARAQDEGIVNVFVPHKYKGDWEHFIKVCTHLHMDPTPGAGVGRGRVLAAEALKPDAPLMDISYCWEALGEEALPAIQPLYTHASPDVAFAAARAGAFIGDRSADETVLRIALTHDHPFQLNAVKVLGALPPTTRTDRMLSQLLSVKNALVRIEAYRILASHESPIIMSRAVRDSFIIDRIPSDGPPLIYATRSGEPRIAIFGERTGLNMPIMFSALDTKLTISTPEDGRSVMIFDRTDPSRLGGLQLKVPNNLYEMLYRLGGGTDDGFRLGYADLVGLLQGLNERKYLSGSFVLQDVPEIRDLIDDAPPIVEPGNAGAPAPAANAAPAADVRAQAGPAVR